MKRSLVLAIALGALPSLSGCMSRATQPPPGGGPQPVPATTGAAGPVAMTSATPTPVPAPTAAAAAPNVAGAVRVLFPIEDVFSISGRGTVATGTIKRGTIKVGDELELLGFRETKRVTVTGIEMFRKMLGEAKAGDNVGLLLRGVEKNEIERGQVLATPGTMKAGTKLTADIEMGTVRTTPIQDGYRPQLQFYTAAVTGTLTLTADIAPGGKGRAAIELAQPHALEAGTPFAVLEGGKAVGKGMIVSAP